MSTIIEVHNLEKQYAPNAEKAVKGISFAIKQGEIFSLLGPNGAGKTTTISMISCLLSPTAGDAIVAGHSIRKEPMKVKETIGVVPQEIALYDTISARENLLFWGRMYGLSGAKLQERIHATLKIAGLEDRANDKVNTFSGGMKRRLNIAVGLLHEPKVLYMDEPTVGIDPQSRRRILDTVKELNQQGLTVLYTTHYMEEAEELSNRIGIIDHGQLVAMGTQDELTQTVGQFDTMTVQLDREMETQALLSGVMQLPGVHQANGTAEQLLIQAKDAKQILPQLLTWVDGQGLHLRGVEIQEPNLEAVFLHLTGHALRD